MATASTVAFFPIIIFGVIAMIIALTLLNSSRQSKRKKSLYSNPNPTSDYQRYVPGQYSQQMELDMRLPYRRWKQLYPHSRITYDEYKRMQMQSAFRRSTSSQENRRMVH
ncbi:MAG: hypothetical protein ACFCUE_05640 [Candidatus Bathyarchaeia archaeon]